MKAQEIDVILEKLVGQNVKEIRIRDSVTFGTKTWSPSITFRLADGREIWVTLRRAGIVDREKNP